MGNSARQSICWECSRSVGQDMCCWAAEGKHVEGWLAEETIFRASKSGEYKGFCVIKCPLFKQDRYEKMDPKQMDTNGCVALLTAMVKRARQDYIDGSIETRCAIEYWMMGKDYMIKKLREEAAREDAERYKGIRF